MENFLYKFEVVMNDGKVLVNDYPKKQDVGGVVCLKFIPDLPLHPIYHFFFSMGGVRLQRFFGRGFLVTGKGKDYNYVILTSTHVIYVNAYNGAIVYADDRSYEIKSRFE